MSAVTLRRLDTSDERFEQVFEDLLDVHTAADPDTERTVRNILEAVRSTGDQALLKYCRELDRLELQDAAALQVSPLRLQQALDSIPGSLRASLEESARRIEHYHRHQLPGDWSMQDADGNRLGQLVRPIERVGIYVPGGRASYPSSVLMNAVPARVAGVGELIMTVPAPDGELADVVLAAAAIAGIDQVYRVGGAQAIGALAFGTQTIPRVDKIVGPGNRFVAEAKRQVYGRVGLDMMAGPSEVLIISDGSGDPDWLALDLFAQAEHDEQAQALLFCPDQQFLDRVEKSMQRLLPEMRRHEIISRSLVGRGALIKCLDLAEAVTLSNRVAPEHLELAVADPNSLLSRVHNAGAIFLGHYSAEVLGDYCAGPSHVLPTAGSARYASVLGVNDFLKRSSLIDCSRDGAARLALTAVEVARSEGLDAHARSAECRLRAAQVN